MPGDWRESSRARTRALRASAWALSASALFAGAAFRRACRARHLGSVGLGDGQVPLRRGRLNGRLGPLLRTRLPALHQRLGPLDIAQGVESCVSQRGVGPRQLDFYGVPRRSLESSERDFGPGDLVMARVELGIDQILATVGREGREGQRHGLGLESASHRFGDARRERIAGRIAIVAADEQQGPGVELRVVGAGDAVPGRVEHAGGLIDPDLMGLEDRANLVILFLEDRVIHVIMATGAADGDAQEGLPGVVDHVLHPLLAAE